MPGRCGNCWRHVHTLCRVLLNSPLVHRSSISPRFTSTVPAPSASTSGPTPEVLKTVVAHVGRRCLLFGVHSSREKYYNHHLAGIATGRISSLGLGVSLTEAYVKLPGTGSTSTQPPSRKIWKPGVPSTSSSETTP